MAFAQILLPFKTLRYTSAINRVLTGACLHACMLDYTEALKGLKTKAVLKPTTAKEKRICIVNLIMAVVSALSESRLDADVNRGAWSPRPSRWRRCRF